MKSHNDHTSARLSCLVVEDEPLAAGILEDYISQVPWLHFSGRCSAAIAAAEVLQEQSVDVLFLDIHLPGMKGLDFLRTLMHPPQVILTTAYHQYALESYDHSVVDYLLKPIEFDRFFKAVQKLKREENAGKGSRPFRFFNTNKKMVRVWIEDIEHVESIREYVKIVLRDQKTVVTKMALSELEKELAGFGFIRAHRSFLVSATAIEAYSATEVTIGGKDIPIGRQYRDEVLERLQG
ncbi:MAG: response regulator transcription factor [Chitinophagales bacterium]|nr:response regulator transcription factor [Chitinophagales bacterium]